MVRLIRVFLNIRCGTVSRATGGKPAGPRGHHGSWNIPRVRIELEGIAKAKAAGVYKGRKPTISGI